ncbi:hypothetical protein ITJ64_02025 [Herbiconiux sp. VKM Ac-1786]|uniref:hypothetical protein n=1 Tax=Herbiconiux sp. VKM Ac-1786 TaxID=2783824 RepID=UPI00188A4C71|nr:hypothetical protein [Herbiconiux sp. VKM Ac-1786]MBF4571285.1 hypothetical protein [Herbiconiux sp. VKM Ac-1786]
MPSTTRRRRRRRDSSRYYVNPQRDHALRIGKIVLVVVMGLVAVGLVVMAMYGDRILS